MRRRAARVRGRAAPLAALLVAACAAPPGASSPADPAPAFTRRWSPYTPEERNRDVIECADAARLELSAEEARWLEPRDVLRQTLFARTVRCMEQRGWVRLREVR